jgi:transcriptional regulator with XRE-family HTH domain
MLLGREKVHKFASQQRGEWMPLDTFGKRLRVLRIDRDLSQIELRDKMEKVEMPIGETYISELERTSKMPSLEVAAAMAKVLDVSIDYLGLLIEEALPYRRQPTPDPYYSEQADEIAKLVDSMHPSQRELILSVAKNMLSAPTQRQAERAEMRDILDSIAREHGDNVRREIEKLMRNKGLPIDSDT